MSTVAKQPNEMSLRDAARFDFSKKAREKLTGWGKICRERALSGKSRRIRIAHKQGVTLYGQ